MRFEKTSPTELRRTAEVVAREGSIRKASIALGVERSTVRRRMAAYNTLSSDQTPDGADAERTACALPSDQIPDGAPVCAVPSDQASNGAPAFTPPPGSHLHWCDLTADEGWQRVAEDGWTTRQRVIRGELIDEKVRVYDPGVIYPPDWTGPRLGDPARQKPKPRAGVRGVIMTSAQDRTPAHGPFLVNLRAFADYHGYELRIGRFTYARDWWMSLCGDVVDKRLKSSAEIAPFPTALAPWLTSERSQVAPGVLHVAEMNILPTAVSPMSGLLTHGKGKSVVYSHTKLSFEMIARSHGEAPKWAATTGACTAANYIERKAGQKARFHHVYGALLIETDADGHVYPTQIHANDADGAFQVYDCRVDRGRVSFGHSIAGAALGDVHIEHMDPEVEAATVRGTRQDISFIDGLKPRSVYIHDLIDFSSRNHHNLGDPIFRHAVRNERIVEEHRRAGQFLASLKRPGSQVIVVKSNHDEAFDKWLRSADWRADPHNAELHLAANLATLQASNDNRPFYALEWSIRALTTGLNHVHFLFKHDQSSICEGVQCGFHGHKGPGGSRGSTRGFLRLASKIAKGHDHTPTIIEGVASTGTMQVLEADYTLGSPTTWAHAHVMIYAGGRMGLCFIHAGRWRALGTKRPTPNSMRKAA